MRITVLSGRGAVLTYHDPFVPSLAEFGLKRAELGGAVSGVAAIVVVTAPGIATHRWPKTRRCSSTFGADPRPAGGKTWSDFEATAVIVGLRHRRLAVRARSSVGERSLHTREVVGSNPTVPIRGPCKWAGLFCPRVRDWIRRGKSPRGAIQGARQRIMASCVASSGS